MSTFETIEAAVALMMPQISGRDEIERTNRRYAGLVKELSKLSLDSFMVISHDSFDPRSRHFSKPFELGKEAEFVPLGQTATATIVRDLTMPRYKDGRPNYDGPLYNNSSGLILVNPVELNLFLADKAAVHRELEAVHPETIVAEADEVAEVVSELPGDLVFIRPVFGIKNKDAQVLTKTEVAKTKLALGDYLVQEYIDTSAGIPELGVEGVHIIRTISIDGKSVGSIARLDRTSTDILRADEIYGRFIENEELPEPMRRIVDSVHEALNRMFYDGRSIIAIDMKYGSNAAGDKVTKLDGLARKPLRISRFDEDRAAHLDKTAIRRMAERWDMAEAKLLASLMA